MSFVALEESIAMLALLMAASRVVGFGGWDRKPGSIPLGSVVLFALVAVPTMAQALWPPVLGALRREPHQITAHHEYWRMFTSMLVQDGGVSGAVFNLVTLAIIAMFAGWFWGGRRTIAMFFCLGFLFDVSSVLYHQAGAGNSGATYGLAATLAGYALLRGPRSLRPFCAGALGIGGVIWALGNIHGAAVVTGGLLGVVLALAAVRPSLTDWYERAAELAADRRGGTLERAIHAH